MLPTSESQPKQQEMVSRHRLYLVRPCLGNRLYNEHNGLASLSRSFGIIPLNSLDQSCNLVVDKDL